MQEPDGLPEWAQQHVPAAMREDPIWRLPAYRYALYLEELIQGDVPGIRQDDRTRAHVDQLVSAVGSISANIAEGYSRSSGRDRAKFFEYAHSSARETRDWLFKVRHALTDEVFSDRLTLVTRIMRILMSAIPRERADRESPLRRGRNAVKTATAPSDVSAEPGGDRGRV